jgi:flagellar motor protein MotB
MLYQISRKLQHSRILMTLLLCVFVSCWAHNAMVGQNLANLPAAAANTDTAAKLTLTDIQKFSNPVQSEQSQSAKTDSCEKTSCLLKQVQLDLPDILPALIIMLVLLISISRTQKPLKFKPQWRPKRRPHALFCCFLE